MTKKFNPNTFITVIFTPAVSLTKQIKMDLHSNKTNKIHWIFNCGFSKRLYLGMQGCRRCT